MKNNRSIIFLFQLLCIAAIILHSCSRIGRNENVSIENGKLRFSFDKISGSLTEFNDLLNSFVYSDEKMPPVSPWEIELSGSNSVQTIDIKDASKFRYRKPNDSTLVLEWKKFRYLKNENFRITAKVTLSEKEPISYWHISLEGTSGIQVNKVVFPRIKISETDGDEYLAIPEWMGQVIKSPREHLYAMKSNVKKYEWSYPGPLSLQCAALYDPDKRGFYAACNDTLAFKKNLSFTLDSTGNLIYQLINFPALDKGSDKYEPLYMAIIGSFRGDWITAAELYRDWGSRQKWSRESRFKTGKTPEWLRKTALWVWNRGRSSNVLVPAADLQNRIGLPVSVFWHWWHGCSYDDGFPEYLPPREGRNAFISAMSAAHEKGINAIVYMNQALWGTTTESWTKEGAENFAAKDANGKTLTHVFNIFTGKPTAYMCMATQFWKDKYSTLCDSAVNVYNANGVYMDMACLNTMCFDTSHGHPVGGGNYHLQNFGKMTSQIRSKIWDQHNLVLAGEGAGEVWMPYLDLFLTLAVSKERYAGVGSWETIPFFQAVYHQYAITYGNYSSLLVPPYDDLWPEEYAPEEPLKMLDRKFSRQFLMEQARSFAWGLQPAISNYQSFLASERKEEISYISDLAKVRNQGLQYLLNGKFLRTPDFKIPSEEFDISRLSIYAGKMGESVTSFTGTFPLIYTGTWKAENDQVGIALASISNDPLKLSFNFNPDDYGLPQAGDIYIIEPEGTTYISSYSDGKISVDFTLKPREICIFEFIKSDH